MNLFIERAGARLSQRLTYRDGFSLRLWVDPVVYPAALQVSSPRGNGWVSIFGWTLGGRLDCDPPSVVATARMLRTALRTVLTEGVAMNVRLDGLAATFGVLAEPLSGDFSYFLAVTIPGFGQLRLPLASEELEEMYSALVNYFELATEGGDRPPLVLDL